MSYRQPVSTWGRLSLLPLPLTLSPFPCAFLLLALCSAPFLPLKLDWLWLSQFQSTVLLKDKDRMTFLPKVDPFPETLVSFMEPVQVPITQITVSVISVLLLSAFQFCLCCCQCWLLKPVLIECLLCTKHRAKHLICLVSPNLLLFKPYGVRIIITSLLQTLLLPLCFIPCGLFLAMKSYIILAACKTPINRNNCRRKLPLNVYLLLAVKTDKMNGGWGDTRRSND